MSVYERFYSKIILVPATCVGSIIAPPFAALTVRRVNAEKLRLAIGVSIIALGALTLMRTFAFRRR